MCDCQEQLRARAAEAGAWGLVVSAANAAKAHVAYSRAWDSAQRAEILIGAGAGQERTWMARQHFRSRTTSLQHLGSAVEAFRASMEPGRVSRADELIAQGSVTELLASARHWAVAQLLDSDVSAGMAGEALSALDQRMEEITAASSAGQLTELLARYVAGHITRTFEEAAQESGLCEIILILSSVFAVLVVVAAIICIFTLGLGCNDILNQLLAQACPG